MLQGAPEHPFLGDLPDGCLIDSYMSRALRDLKLGQRALVLMTAAQPFLRLPKSSDRLPDSNGRLGCSPCEGTRKLGGHAQPHRSLAVQRPVDIEENTSYHHRGSLRQVTIARVISDDARPLTGSNEFMH